MFPDEDVVVVGFESSVFGPTFQAWFSAVKGALGGSVDTHSHGVDAHRVFSALQAVAHHMAALDTLLTKKDPG